MERGLWAERLSIECAGGCETVADIEACSVCLARPSFARGSNEFSSDLWVATILFPLWEAWFRRISL